MASSALCPHCGKPDAPVDNGYIDRHRRADWVRDVSPGNEVCYGGGLWLKVGESCFHTAPSENCWEAGRG